MFDNTQLVYQSVDIIHQDAITCGFRQWRAQSHCRFVHAYKISVNVGYYVSEDLNTYRRFGVEKQIRDLVLSFDGKLLIAADDPEREMLIDFADSQLRNSGYLIIEHTGCERMAEHIYNQCQEMVKDRATIGRVMVMEHEANMGSYGIKGVE